MSTTTRLLSMVWLVACGPAPSQPFDASPDVQVVMDASPLEVDAAVDVAPAADDAGDGGADDATQEQPVCEPGDGPAPEAAPACEQGASIDLNGLPAAELPNYLRSKPVSCLYFLWTLDDALAASLQADVNVFAVANALRDGAATYEGDNAGGEASLLFYLRARWYHDFYAPETFSASDRTRAVQATQAALNAMSGVVDAARTSPGEHQVIEMLTHVADAAGLMHTEVPLWSYVLNAGADSIVTGALSYARGNSLFALLVALERNIRNGEDVFKAAIDDALFRSVERLIQEGCGPLYVVNNAIYALGGISSIARFRAEGQRVLTEALARFVRLSEPFLWLVRVLDEHHECMTTDGRMLCRHTIAPEVEALVFPHEWVMGGGSTIFVTSLPFETALRLHYALEQVRSRFERLLESAPPIDDDANDVATFRIYGTRAEYQTYNTWLYGLPTNNGGIYIEQDGTLYTYERTPEESVFTLEDLVRHEYVHYLIGRYAGAGLWGEHPIYDDDRMVFYDEGISEFLAGSTSRNGVPTRRQLVENIRGDDFMSVSEVTQASYASGFRFYNYAGLFFDYLYRERLSDFRSLLFAAREGDVGRFDAVTQRMRGDGSLSGAYQEWLRALLDDESLEDIAPVTPPSGLSASVDDIQGAMRGTRLGHAAECAAEESDRFRGFVCVGDLSGELRPRYSEDDAWRSIDTTLDQLLQELVETGLSNFLVTNCAFEEVTVNQGEGGEYPTARFLCTGPRAM